MRIALITLSLVALLFIGSLMYSFAWGKIWALSLPKIPSSSTETPIAVETLKYQIKTDQKLEELTKKLDSLTIRPQNDINTISSSWTLDTLSPIPVSGKLLSILMPKMEFSLTWSIGIYDLHIFDQSIHYSTYEDKKNGVRLIPMDVPYDIFLKNIKALDDTVYSVNETKTFPFRSFYINPPKSDWQVRIVIEVEKQTIAIQTPKQKFQNLKTLLLKK